MDTIGISSPYLVVKPRWPPKIFEKKKVNILKYELFQPIKQFSRLDMLLAPQIPNKYLDIHQSPLFQQIKEKKILVKKQF